MTVGSQKGIIVISDKDDAETVLGRMNELITKNGFVTVSDFYDLVNIVPQFSDTKRGWYDLASARVEPAEGGYVFRLPETQEISDRPA